MDTVAINPKKGIAEFRRKLEERTAQRDEALAQQTAAAEVLQVINSSPGNLAFVFDTIVEKAVRLCDAYGGALWLVEGGSARATGGRSGNMPKAFYEYVEHEPVPVRYLLGRDGEHRPYVHTVDLKATKAYQQGIPFFVANVDLGGARTALSVPLTEGNALIGVFTLIRQEVRPFIDNHIAVVQRFAAQAVIAIRTARLLDEVRARTDDLRESLQQQTATAEVLKVISRSTFDLHAVLTTLVQSARELCNAPQGMVLLRDGEVYRTAIQLGYPAEFERCILDNPIQPNPHSGAGRAAFTGKVVHFPDVMADPEYRLTAGQRLGGYRTLLSIPLLRELEVLGVFSLGRTEPDPFTPRQIELVQTFADQAVIAIENVRLFNEVQARTRELTEALEIQTASANILRAIASSPTDVAPVLKVIVESACELCGAYDAVALLKEGEYLLFGAHHGSIPIELGSIRISRSWTPGLAVIEQRTVHIHDLLSSEGDQVSEAQRRAKEFGYRTILSVPMLREKESVGVLALRRAEAHPFDNKQIALLQSFADQAVIAIENARLFEQLQARTSELSQSLDELRTAQDRLVHTEKLASLGQLTAGIAHEIKNPLNFVNNFASLSRELIEELKETIQGALLDAARRSNVDEIIATLSGNLDKVSQHGRRADSIVKNMLLHSREGTGEHRLVGINALVEESLNLAYHGARAERPDFNVKLERDLDPNAAEADIYPQEVTRVLLNLISNGFYERLKRAILSSCRFSR